jgi:hypothetical protein
VIAGVATSDYPIIPDRSEHQVHAQAAAVAGPSPWSSPVAPRAAQCRPQTLTSLCSAFTYDNADRRTTTQYPGGATLAITYDNAGNELTVIGESSTNTTLTSFTYCYRDLVSGNCPAAMPISHPSKVTHVKENDPRATLTADYLYDSAGRLCSSATIAGGTCAPPPRAPTSTSTTPLVTGPRRRSVNDAKDRDRSASIFAAGAADSVIIYEAKQAYNS